MMDLTVQRNRGGPIQHDRRQEQSHAAFFLKKSGPLKWLFSLCMLSANMVRQGGFKRMISGGNATVFISNMDAAVRFYTEVLGLKLTNRFGNSWATVEAGKGLTIGLHPASLEVSRPWNKGSHDAGVGDRRAHRWHGGPPQ